MTQNELKLNEVYNGFKVVDISEISEYKSVGILLKHEITGLEVFHMLNEDEENLFSFGFKTPSSDSKGTAHIIEHSVLCGSKNYPLKDPFIKLSNQSMHTFLNAMTFPDKTLYPASSTEEVDYFNLMAVYGDAVFFPLLTKETFMQEAHRLEFDKNGKLNFQGVVFNEMKGDYSGLSNLIHTYVIESLFEDSSYAYDSGGNPFYIPDLTYEEFIEFHKFYYHPSNCKLFLYGNISTKKQLDFINEKFLSKITEKSHPEFDVNKIEKMTFSKKFDSPKYITKIGPIENSSKGSNVVLAWKSNEITNQLELMELILIFEILLGHDGAPLYRAILQSGLCEDLSNSYFSTALRYIMYGFGVRGVKKGKEKLFEKFIFEQLNKIIKDGISQDEIESALMSQDFSNREIRRASGGPYSLVLMQRAYRNWMNGSNPAGSISCNEVFNEIKENIKNNKDYLNSLIEKYLLNNNSRICLTVIPDKKYNKKFDKILKNKIDLICKSVPKKERKSFFEKIKTDTKKLNEFQKTPETPENCNLIPHLTSKDIKVKFEKSTIEKSEILGVDIYENKENVNGIVYINLCFPIDLLEPKDYFFLSFYADVLTNLGFDGKSWIESSLISTKCTGDFTSTIINSSCPKSFYEKIGCKDLKDAQLMEYLYKYDPNIARNWLVVRIKMLEEKTEEAVKMLFSSIKTVDFSDTERLSDLLTEYTNDLCSSITSMGYNYPSMRASCKMSKNNAIDEILCGVSQLFAIKSQDFSKQNIKALQSKLEQIHKTVIDSGFIVHLVAEESGLEKAKSCLKQQIQEFPCYKGKVKPPFMCSDDEFYKLTEIQGDSEQLEHFVFPTQVGIYAQSFSTSLTDVKSNVYTSLFAHWLSNTVLWEQLRTIGGCYGAHSSFDMQDNVFNISTYRDPNPYKSKEIVKNIFENIDNWGIDETEFERIKTGFYSKITQPKSPSAKGFIQFRKILYGVDDEYRFNNTKLVLEATVDNLVCNAKSICQDSKTSKSAIIFTKNEDFTSKFINLPL